MRKTLDSLRVFVAASYMTVQPKEHQDGTDQSLKYADNTRAFDGQAAHTQGGTQDVDGSNGAVVQADASTTVGVRDVRLKSAATATVMPTVTSAASTNNSETRVAFVPAGQNSAQGEVRLVTQDMIESAGSSMFGAAGLGVLGAVGLGATASAAEAAAVQANVVSAGNNANPSTTSGNAVSTNNQFTTTLPTSGASSNTLLTLAEVVVKQAEVLSAPVSVMQGVQTVQTAATLGSTTTGILSESLIFSTLSMKILRTCTPECPMRIRCKSVLKTKPSCVRSKSSRKYNMFSANTLRTQTQPLVLAV